MRRQPVLIACALTVALAACGSNGGSKGGGGSSSTSRTTRPDPVIVADRALAHAAVLRSEDLPGFTTNPRTDTGEQGLQELADGIPGCEFLVAGKRDGRVHVRSPRFTQGQVRIAEDVSVYDTPAQLSAQLDLYRDPGIIGCLQSVYLKAIQARLPKTTTMQDVSVSPIAVENAGDGQFGFRLTVTVVEGGTARTVLSDIVGVAVGRVGFSLNVDAPDTAGLAQVETRLMPLLADRVEAAEH